MTAIRNILFKLTLIYILLIIFGFMIIGKIVYLHLFYDKDLIAQATRLTTRYSEIEPNRGDIYSSDKKLLATSIPYFEVGIDLNCDGLTQKLFEENVDSLSYCLSKMFPNKSREEFKKELISNRDSGSRYYRFSSSLDYENFKRMKDFPLLRLGRFTGGFVYRKISKRENPFGSLARRTIGTVRSDTRRGVGLEDAYDEKLKGIKGYTVMQRISGRMWMPVSDFNHIEPKDGYDLITTIDITMQDIAETALKKQLIHHDAEFGTVVVMEVATGKVKAIVNLTKNSNGDYVEYYYNYAVGRATDPGSTFKLASIIVALEDGYIEPCDMVETGNGICYYYGHKVEDVLKGGYGTITAQKSFEVSSNVGISQIINKNYKHQPEKFIDRLYKLELNNPLGVVIRGEPSPTVPYPGDAGWSGLSLTQISIGYEVQITPLQILAFYNAIANNGCLVKPVFAEKLKYRGEIVKTFNPEIINPSICSQQTLLKVKEMLKGVVENGTARNIKSKNFEIAGKTGTSQLNYGKTNDDKKIEFLSSFAGYFPADDPKYSMVVSVFNPRKNGYYGSIVAAPVFKEIAEKIYAFYPDFYLDDIGLNQEGVIPVEKKSFKYDLEKIYRWFNISTNINTITNSVWVGGDRTEEKINYNPVHFSDKSKVPNVINMKAKDAVIILEQMGLNVTIHGRGKVVRQSPAQGTNINQVKNVVIFLDV